MYQVIKQATIEPVMNADTTSSLNCATEFAFYGVLLIWLHGKISSSYMVGMVVKHT